MKTSDKCGFALILALFIGPALWIVATRLLQGYEWTNGDAGGKLIESPGDAGGFAVPEDRVRWSRITLGLRSRFNREIDESRGIFKDIGLAYDGHHYLAPFIEYPYWPEQKTGIKHICELTFRFHRTSTDTIDVKAHVHHENAAILIRMIKSTSMAIPLKQRLQKVTQKRNGVLEGWVYDLALCEWARGRWQIEVLVPLVSCRGDSVEATGLRDRIRDRLCVYFETLK
jgi:hypothetical protein